MYTCTCRAKPLLLAALFPSLLSPALAPARPLSMAEALSRAEQYVPELVQAQNEVRLTRARRPGAALLLPQNPYASLLMGKRRERDPSGDRTGFQYAFHLEQQVEIAGQRWTRLRTVDRAVAAASASAAMAGVLGRALVRTAYVQGVLADQRVQVQRTRAEVSRQLLDSASARSSLGAANDIETNLARIEMGRVTSDVLSSEVERETRYADLRILTGLPEDTPLELVTPLADPPPPTAAAYQSLEALVTLALQRRPDLQALQRRQAELSAQASQLRRDVVPSPVLSLDVQRDLPGQFMLGGTVGLPFPLWNRNQGPLAQVSALEQNRQAEERLLLTRIRNEVSLAQQNLRRRREELSAFRTLALGAAEANVALLRRGWQAGKFDLFRVITALREGAEVRARYYTILEQLWLALIDLERAVAHSPLTTPSEAP